MELALSFHLAMGSPLPHEGFQSWVASTLCFEPSHWPRLVLKNSKLNLSLGGWLTVEKFCYLLSMIPDSLYLSLFSFFKVSWEQILNTNHGHLSTDCLFFRNQSTHEIVLYLMETNLNALPCHIMQVYEQKVKLVVLYLDLNNNKPQQCITKDNSITICLCYSQKSM